MMGRQSRLYVLLCLAEPTHGKNKALNLQCQFTVNLFRRTQLPALSALIE